MNLRQNGPLTCAYLPYAQWSDTYQHFYRYVLKLSYWGWTIISMNQKADHNDPNGYFLTWWEIAALRQFYPMGPVHGVKSWPMWSSKIWWIGKRGIALLLDSDYDQHGVYSGSGDVMMTNSYWPTQEMFGIQMGTGFLSNVGAYGQRWKNNEREKNRLFLSPPEGYTHEFLKWSSGLHHKETYWLWSVHKLTNRKAKYWYIPANP